MHGFPPAINYHINRTCNAACTFCFATFPTSEEELPLDEARRMLDMLHRAGAKKINFAGGEPTLHPNLGQLLAHSREIGFVTSVVTNGARLRRLLDSHASCLDWAGLSVDSAEEAVEVALGRGRGHHVRRAIELADAVRSHGIRLKLNTVVTALNRHEDLGPLVRRMRPDRWKVFQVLRIEGENDDTVGPLLIDAAEFEEFVRRHDYLATEGFRPIVEGNDAMRGSYAMIDPSGRFYGNAGGGYAYSRRIVDVGVDAAFAEVAFAAAKFVARGGSYAW